MVQCYACKSEYPTGTTLCERCKAPLPSWKQKGLGKCPACKGEIPINASHCPSCSIELIGENAPIAESGFPEEQIQDLKQLNIVLNKLLTPLNLELPLPPVLHELKELIMRLSEEEHLELTVGKLAAVYLAYTRLLGNIDEQLEAHEILGSAYFGLSDYYAGASTFIKGFQLASQQGRKKKMALFLLNFGIGYEENGHYYTAEHAYSQAKRILKDSMDYELYFQVLTNLFTSLMFQDKYDQASEVLEELLVNREGIIKVTNKDEVIATLFLMSQQLYWNQIYNEEFIGRQEDRALKVLETLEELLPELDLRVIHFIMIERFCILAQVVKYSKLNECISLLLEKAEKSGDKNEVAAMILKLLPAFQEGGDLRKVEEFKKKVFTLEEQVTVTTVARAIEVLHLEELCEQNQLKIRRAMHYYPDDLTKVELRTRNKFVKNTVIQFQPLETLYGVSLMLSRERVKAYFKDVSMLQGNTGKKRLEVVKTMYRIANGKIGIKAKEEVEGGAPRNREIPFLQATETFVILGMKGENVYGIQLIGTEIQQNENQKPVFMTYEIFGYYTNDRRERKELLKVLDSLFSQINELDKVMVIVAENQDELYYQPILRSKGGKERMKRTKNYKSKRRG